MTYVMIKKQKAKWAHLCRPSQGMPLSKRTIHNRVSARSLLGEGESKRASERSSRSGDMREADRQTDRQTGKQEE